MCSYLYSNTIFSDPAKTTKLAHIRANKPFGQPHLKTKLNMSVNYLQTVT